MQSTAILKKIMSDSGVNFISDKFKTFWKSLNIEQAFSSSYHHQINRKVEACIKIYEEQDINQRKGEENIGQKLSAQKSPVKRSSDNKEDGQDNVIRTRYGRIIKKTE